MAMALTKDERLVLRYLASGSIEEIAAPQLAAPGRAVDLHASAHRMGAGRTRRKYHPRCPPPRKRTGMKDAAPVVVGYAIGLVLGAIRFLVMFVVGGAIVLGFARALGSSGGF